MKPIRLRSDNASEYRRIESGEQGLEIRTVLSWLAGEKDEVWVTSSYGRSEWSEGARGSPLGRALV